MIIMEIELSPGAEAPKPNGDKKIDSLKELVISSFNSMSNGNSFNRILKGVKVLSAMSPTILAELTLTEEHANDQGIMHSGFTAAMADILTATAVRLTVSLHIPIVSVDLSITYIQPARIGETVLMEASCLSAGQSIAFTEAIFRRKSDNELIVKASQQLAILYYRSQSKGRKDEHSDNKNNSSEAPATNGFAKTHRQETNETTKLERAQLALTRMGTSENFNRISKNLRVGQAESLALQVEIKLGSEHLNEGGTMHGGFVASLVDIVSVRAVDIAVQQKCSMMSMFASISYLMPAKIGDEIVVRSECLKVGRSIAFTETTISRKSDGTALAKGKHNIYLTRQPDSAQGEGQK